jgi:myo-inositol 2-dehydrogenase / D-chiro-inositol 1-dehydrogenase
VKRRYFLLGSAAAAHATFAQSPADTVPTAVIGTGNRGSYLLRTVLAQPNAKVVMVCDNKPDRLDRAATAAAEHAPATTTDWRKVIEDKDVAAVYIATPPNLHAKMAVAALEAGKHVYCEKPIGITPRQVADVLKAARASKKVFLAGQQLRSVNQYQRAIQAIRDGAIGDVIWVKAQRHATADLPYDGSSGDWYYDVSKSGGYLIEQSVHNLDLCNWAIGTHPDRCSGIGTIALHKNEPPGRTIFDSGSMTYVYPKGVTMSFTQMVFHPRTLPAGGQYIYVYGTKGALDLMGGTTFHPLDPKAQPQVLAEKQPENDHAHTVAFYDAILKGSPLPADAAVGATAALTAILGHEAMTQEKVVTWKSLGVEV